MGRGIKGINSFKDGKLKIYGVEDGVYYKNGIINIPNGEGDNTWNNEISENQNVCGIYDLARSGTGSSSLQRQFRVWTSDANVMGKKCKMKFIAHAYGQTSHSVQVQLNGSSITLQDEINVVEFTITSSTLIYMNARASAPSGSANYCRIGIGVFYLSIE